MKHANLVSMFVKVIQKILSFIGSLSLKKKPKFLNYFFYSVLGHFALFFTVMLLFKSSGIRKPLHLNEPIEISFVDNDSSEFIKSNSALKTKPTKKINFTGKTSAEILEYKLNTAKMQNKVANSDASASYFKDNAFQPTAENYDSYAESGAHGYLEKGGITKIFENNKFYQEIWKRVRSSTGFPKDFLNFRLNGQVRIHALVNNKGELIGDFTKVSSENALLELYSMAILSSSLSKPLEPRFWTKDQQIPLIFEFNFNLVVTETDENLNKMNEGSYAGNIFNLTTTRYVKPIIIQHIDHFLEDFMPPVLILPGMIYVDLVSLYNKYYHWKKHGLQRQSVVRQKEYKNIRKEILNALKTSKPNVLQVLNKKSFGDNEQEDYQTDNMIIDRARFSAPSATSGK